MQDCASVKIADDAWIERTDRRHGRHGANGDLIGGFESDAAVAAHWSGACKLGALRHDGARNAGEADGARRKRRLLAAGGAVAVDQPDVAVPVKPFGFRSIWQ